MHASRTLSHSQSTVPSAKRDRKVIPMPDRAPAAQSHEVVISADSPQPDFVLENHGSLFLLRSLTALAHEWMNEHLPVDHPETQFFAGAIVIEPRYIGPIVEGIVGDGLVLR